MAHDGVLADPGSNYFTGSSYHEMTDLGAGVITSEYATIFAVLGVQNSVKSRVSYGGTAPANVVKQIARWRKLLAKENGKTDAR